MAIAQRNGQIFSLQLPEDIAEEERLKEAQENTFYTPKFGCSDDEAEDILRHLRKTQKLPTGLYGTSLEWFMSWALRESNATTVEGYGFTAKQVIDICIGVNVIKAA